jgi:plastocyanin
MIGRRALLGTGGLLLAGLSSPISSWGREMRAQIEMRSSLDGGKVWFDPIGLAVEPGTTVRWLNTGNVHTATAYHPDNDKHSLRIPESAAPWDSGYLVNPGDSFEVLLSVPGVYDYYCLPHENAGMVGRIIVGSPSGPGSRPFDYFKAGNAAPAWREVPPAARQNFPSVARIVAEGLVRWN